MKKTLRLSLMTSAVLIAASTACFANANYKGENYKGEAMAAPCPSPLMIRDGFYLGLQAGYDSYRIRAGTTAVSGGVSYTNNPVLNASGFVGGGYLGYGQYFNDVYYLGAEIFVNGSNANSASTASQTSIAGVTNSVYSKVSVGTSYGISLLPGVKVNDASLLYVRLGYNRAHIKGQSQVVSNNVTLLDSSTSSWRSGFNYGLGMEMAFYQNWSVRGEFTHTNYSSFSSSVTNTTYSPSDNQFMVGLSYHFA
jgi:outer membrane immunogenic protein